MLLLASALVASLATAGELDAFPLTASTRSERARSADTPFAGSAQANAARQTSQEWAAGFRQHPEGFSRDAPTCQASDSAGGVVCSAGVRVQRAIGDTPVEVAAFGTTTTRVDNHGTSAGVTVGAAAYYQFVDTTYVDADAVAGIQHTARVSRSRRGSSLRTQSRTSAVGAVLGHVQMGAARLSVGPAAALTQTSPTDFQVAGGWSAGVGIPLNKLIKPRP